MDRAPHSPSRSVRPFGSIRIIRITRAFTLSQLLVSLAVIAALSILALPAAQSLLDARGSIEAARAVAQLLEQARTDAVTRQTYVWVGFLNTADGGSSSLLVAAAYSLDGSGNNTTPANLRMAEKPLRIRDTAVVPLATLFPSTRTLVSSPTMSLASNRDGISTLQVSQAKLDRTITFTPQGEALLKGSATPDDGYDNAIDIGFCQAKGATLVHSARDVVIVLDGATGTARSLHP